MNEEEFETHYLIACVASGTLVPRGPDYDSEDIIGALGIANLPRRSELINHLKREDIANLFCPGRSIRSVMGARDLFVDPVTEVPVVYHGGEEKVYLVMERSNFGMYREALGQSLSNILLGENMYNFFFDPNKDVLAMEILAGNRVFINKYLDSLSENIVKNYAKAIELAEVLDLGMHYDQSDEEGASYPFNVLLSEEGNIINTNLGALFIGYQGFVREEEMMALYGDIITEERK